MDQQGQKPLTLDDILNQLSKPAILKELQVQDGGKVSSTPEIKPSLDSQLKIPSLGENSKPTSVSDFYQNKRPQAPMPKPSGISLSIRVMSDDLLRLQKGQKPQGIEVKKVIQTISEPPVKPALPPETPSKIEEAARDLPKTQILPENQGVKLPDLKPPSFKSEKSVGSIGSIPTPTPRISEKQQYSLPSLPFMGGTTEAVKQKPILSHEEKVEYKTIARVVSSGITTGIIGTIIVSIGIYYALDFFVFKGEEDLTVITPTPLPTQLTTPAINELEAIFSAILTSNFSLPADESQTSVAFKSFINNETTSRKEFKRVNFVSASGQDTKDPTLVEFLTKLGVNHPQELGAVIKDNNVTLLYGQEESFSQTNQPAEGTPKYLKRIVFVAEVTNNENTSRVLKNWEVSMANDLKILFDLDLTKQATSTFLDNEHGGVMIRYKNFPLPDNSIDYAIVSSLSGKHYLIISNSRESMYSPLDKIRGLR